VEVEEEEEDFSVMPCQDLFKRTAAQMQVLQTDGQHDASWFRV